MKRAAPSDPRLYAQYDALAYGVVIHDTSGAVVYANPEASRILDRTLDQLHSAAPVQTSWCAACLDEAGLPIERDPILDVSRTGRPRRDITLGFERQAGERRWIRLDAVPIVGEDGTTAHVVAGFMEITAQRQAEERIRFQAGLLDSVDQAVIALDLTGVVTYWSRHAELLFGWPASDVLGCNADIIVPSIDGGQGAAEIWAQLQAGNTWSGEFLLRRRDGSTFSAWITDSPIFDEQGKLIGMVGVSTDYTKRKSAELEARRARIAAEELASLRQEQAEEAAVMAEVTAALAQAMEPAALYQLILEQAARLLPCNSSYVFLLRGDWAEVAASWGEPRLPIGARPFSLTVAERRRYWPAPGEPPRYYPDMQQVPGHDPTYPWLGRYLVHSIITASLVIDGELLGCFDIMHHQPGFYTERHVRLVGTFAERATQALRTARFLAAEHERVRVAEELAALRQEQVEQAEAMAEVSALLAGTLEPDQVYALILDQVSRVLPYDHAAVLLHQAGWVTVGGSRGKLTLPTGEPVFPLENISAVATFGTSGKPALIRDTAMLPDWLDVPPFIHGQRIRSVIVVPLVVDHILVGTFNVDSLTANFYTERHLAIATAFGARVTQALYNARLHTAEQDRARAAEKLFQLQSDFVDAVSHELRTPLTAMVGFSELLQTRWHDLSDRERLGQVGKIVEAATRQKRLVQDLLLIRQLDANSLRPVIESQPLGPILEEAASEVRGSYKDQPIDLVGIEGCAVQTDRSRVFQIVTNLLDNAAKYSPEGSPITVTWAREEAWVVVRVRDQGSGIPETGRAQLFSRFGRMPGSRIRAGRVGTGLGLYLGRLLAHAMGGNLELESTGPGGSTFRLRLPPAVEQP
jgi:PAS domain S-box-containing protein